MATFKYKGKSVSGKVIEGIVKAADKDQAAIEVKRTVDIIESIKKVEESPDLFANFFKPKITTKSLALVCRQFAIILDAGLPIVTSIRLVAGQVSDQHLKEVLEDVCEHVKGGSNVGDAFELREPNLPTSFIETIRAGEASGRLDIAFGRLATYFEKRNKTSSKVTSALIYPIVVLCMAVIVVAILMVYAVPKFTETFAQLGTELPWITKALIALSDFFVSYIWLMIFLGIIGYIAFRKYLQNEEGRYKFDKFRLTVPVLGTLRMMTAASEFANTFSTMLAAGVPAIKALNITGKSITNYSISEDVIESCTLVASGYKIGDSLKASTQLPELLLEIVGVGENSGSMESTLQVISEFYDNEVETASANAIAILEPALILVLAVIVLFVLLSVYLPMFSMYGSM